MASRKGIPVINMADPNWRSQLDAVINRQSSVSETNVSLPTGEQMTDEQWNRILSNMGKGKAQKIDAFVYRDIKRAEGKTDAEILNKIKECL
jgi:aspartate/tyrosine/aromatic aminotransferase